MSEQSLLNRLAELQVALRAAQAALDYERKELEKPDLALGRAEEWLTQMMAYCPLVYIRLDKSSPRRYTAELIYPYGSSHRASGESISEALSRAVDASEGRG